MNSPASTLQLLQSSLPSQDLPVVIETPDGPLGVGFHVTEVKIAHLQSIDCGRQDHGWSEVIVQLLDGAGGRSMTSSKLSGILSAASAQLGDHAQTELRFEGSRGNTRLEQFRLGGVQSRDGSVVVTLEAVQPTCKPSARFAPAASGTCCG